VSRALAIGSGVCPAAKRKSVLSGTRGDLQAADRLWLTPRPRRAESISNWSGFVWSTTAWNNHLGSLADQSTMKYRRVLVVHSFADAGMEARLEQIDSDARVDDVGFAHYAII
jgi:hypothetical protein